MLTVSWLHINWETTWNIVYFIHLFVTYWRQTVDKIVINKSIIKYTSFPYAVIKNETYIFDGEKVKYFLKDMYGCVFHLDVCVFVRRVHPGLQGEMAWRYGVFFCLSLSLSTTFQSCGQGLFFMWNANIWKNRIKMFKINGDRSLMK